MLNELKQMINFFFHEIIRKFYDYFRGNGSY